MKKLLLSLVLLATLVSCSTPDDIQRGYSIVMISSNGFSYVKKNNTHIQSDNLEEVQFGGFIINHAVSGDVIEGKCLYPTQNESTVQVYVRPDDLPEGQISGIITYFFSGNEDFQIILP